MKLRLQNQLNMVGTAITTAQDSNFKPTWGGQDPADFGPDLVSLTEKFGSISAKHAAALAATGGAADAKASAEAPLEAIAYTTARVAILTAAIAAFESLLNHPRGQIVNRSTLLKEVETDTAALLDDLRDLDDLVLQFEGSAPGDRFIQAWKKARIIVDAGHGPGQEEDQDPAPSPSAL